MKIEHKIYLFIALVLISLGYVLGAGDKKEAIDGLIHTVMVCNAKR